MNFKPAKALLLLLCLSTNTFAQIPSAPKNIQSPTATAFAAYGDIPVSLYTGKPDISVNLHQLSDGPIEIPVSLVYDPSGVRPDVHPGWTGLNFSLSTNYSVTRKINDGPDDGIFQGALGQYGYLFYSANLNTPDWASAGKMKANADLSTGYDFEPDEYTFNIPGLSGKFYYGHDQKWKISCDRPVTVKFLGNSASVKPPFTTPAFITGGNDWLLLGGGYLPHMEGFLITDEFGTEFTFGGGDPAYSEYSMDFFSQGKSTWFCNNWYLKTIKRHTGQIINFTYERGALIAQMNFSVANRKSSVNGAGFLNTDCSMSTSIIPLSGVYSGKLVSPIYLKEIISDQWKVKFFSSASTELRYEDNIFSTFVNHYTGPLNNGLMIDILTYLYDCFYPVNSNSCAGNATPLSTLLSKLQWRKLDKIQIQNGSGVTIKEFLLSYNNLDSERLMLKKVQEKSGYNAKALPPYEFEYYTDPGISLPGYGKSHTDHWGYNNGKLININTDFDNPATYGLTFRNPPVNKKHYLLGSLRQIKYPTGGVTKFVFEPHSYASEVKLKRWEGLDNYGANQVAGGLRIKEIHHGDPVNPQVPTVIKKYYYLNGFNPVSPDTTTLLSSGILSGKSQYWWTDYKPKPVGNFTYTQQVFSTQSVLPETENSTGAHIGYSQVIERSSTEGWTVYSFTNFDNGYLDEPATGFLQTTTTPYEPYQSNAFKRGKLIERKQFFQGGKLAGRTETKYTTIGSLTDAQARSFKSARTELCSPSGNYVYEGTAWLINTQKFLPYEETTFNYDQDDLSKFTFVARISAYKPNGQLKELYQTDSKTNPVKVPLINPPTNVYDRQRLTEYKYANDFADAISADMTNKNMIAAPLEVQARLATVTAGAFSYTPLNSQKVTYNAARLPLKVESQQGNAPVPILDYEFLSYDGRGNLLTYKDRSGSVIKLEYYGLADAGKADMVKSRTLSDGSPLLLTTLADYKPAVGVSKITDPNGKSQDFEYDDFNRLQFVKGTGQIRKSYCYNYAGQAVECAAIAPAGSIAATTLELIASEALPVKLIEFNAHAVEQTAILSWSTANEEGSAAFEIERSINGKKWDKIGSLPAAGDSDDPEHYTFTDHDPVTRLAHATENFYRLKMTDLDGTFSFSEIRNLSFGGSDEILLYPNPVTVGNTLNITIKDISLVREILLFDTGGKQIKKYKPERQLDIGRLAPGLYMLQFTFEDGSIANSRIVKQ